MEHLVIIVAVVVSVGALQPPRAIGPPGYRDSPPFLDHPPPPLISSGQPDFYSSAYSRPETYLRHPQSFDEDDSIVYNEPPPSRFREDRIFFDSPYFSPQRPKPFYQDSFPANALGSAREYRGPPPPAPLREDVRNKQPTSGSRDERPRTPLELSTTKAHEELRSLYHQKMTAAEARQPLSFGGHSSPLSYGDHSLGFASVAAVTSADMNPLPIARLVPGTTRAASTISMHLPSTMSVTTGTVGFQRQQPDNTLPHPLPPEVQTLSPPSLLPKITLSSATSSQSSPNTVRLNDLVSSTPATTRLTPVSPKSGLDPVHNQLSQMTNVPTIMLQDVTKIPYEFSRAVGQGLPSVSLGQLPIEALKQQFQISDIKHNFLIYDTKSSLPYYQPSLQINQQSSGSSGGVDNRNINNISPLRFSIPTTPISSASASEVSAPMKIAIQGVDFSRTPITLTAVPTNINTYTTGQEQIESMQLNKLNPGTNTPLYNIAQNSEQNKPANQVSAGIPLGSFYVLPNDEQTKLALQAQTSIPSGLQLQLSGPNGLQYILQSSNSDQARSANVESRKVGPNHQQRSLDPSYSQIGYQQNRW